MFKRGFIVSQILFSFSVCVLMLYHRWLPVHTGNKELVKNAEKFWWFGHIWNHYQPHLLQTKEQLVKLMKQNYEFAVVSQYIFTINLLEQNSFCPGMLGHVRSCV